MKKSLLWLSIMMLAGVKITAQNTNILEQSKFQFTSSIQSNWLWRGLVLTTKPIIKGDLSYALDKNKNLSVGISGVVELGNESDGTQYKEIDYYIRYSYKRFFIGISDSYTFQNINTAVAADDIFNYSKKRTTHLLALKADYTFSDNFPLNIEAHTYFYGGANTGEVLLKPNGDYDKNKYSTYLEVSYPVIQGEMININTFLGGAFAINGGNSLYGDGKNRFQIINVGLKASKNVKISEYYTLPVAIMTIWNPTLKYGGMQLEATIF